LSKDKITGLVNKLTFFYYV